MVSFEKKKTFNPNFSHFYPLPPDMVCQSPLDPKDRTNLYSLSDRPYRNVHYCSHRRYPYWSYGEIY